ncbi:MAG: hypothetical protein AAFQ43_00210 [Bacteroidota bacterium]
MPILIDEGRAPEPLKFQAEEARDLVFKTPWDLTGDVVRFELVDARSGTQVTLQPATLDSSGNDGSVFTVPITSDDTMSAGRYQLMLTRQAGGVGSSQVLPGGILLLVVTGATRTSTTTYIEDKAAEAAASAQNAAAAASGVTQEADRATAAATTAEGHRDTALAARDAAAGHVTTAQAARDAAIGYRDEAQAARDTADGHRQAAETASNAAQGHKDLAQDARVGAEAAAGVAAQEAAKAGAVEDTLFGPGGQVGTPGTPSANDSAIPWLDGVTYGDLVAPDGQTNLFWNKTGGSDIVQLVPLASAIALTEAVVEGAPAGAQAVEVRNLQGGTAYLDLRFDIPATIVERDPGQVGGSNGDEIGLTVGVNALGASQWNIAVTRVYADGTTGGGPNSGGVGGGIQILDLGGTLREPSPSTGSSLVALELRIKNNLGSDAADTLFFLGHSLVSGPATGTLATMVGAQLEVVETGSVIDRVNQLETNGAPPGAHGHTSGDISDFAEAVQDAVAALLGAGSNVTLVYDDANDSLSISSTGGGSTDLEAVRDAMGVALVGVGNVSIAVDDAGDTITITTQATKNATDAALRDRATHTGVQSMATIAGLTAALAMKMPNVVQETVVGNRTLTAADDGKRLVVIAPAQLTVEPLAAGVQVEVVNASNGAVTIVGGSGVTYKAPLGTVLAEAGLAAHVLGIDAATVHLRGSLS